MLKLKQRIENCYFEVVTLRIILFRFDRLSLMYWVCIYYSSSHFRLVSNFKWLSWFQSHISFGDLLLFLFIFFLRKQLCFEAFVYCCFLFSVQFVASQIIIINWQQANNCKMDLLLQAKRVVFFCLLLLLWRHTISLVRFSSWVCPDILIYEHL